MSYRIEVGIRPGHDDPRGAVVRSGAREFLELDVDRVCTRTVYKADADITPAELDRLRVALTDPVIEESAVGQLPLPDCDWVVSVGFKPGVTDNVGRTARVFMCDLLGRPLDTWEERPQLFTETVYLVWGSALQADQVGMLARDLLANPLIERIEVAASGEYRDAPVNLDLPRAGDSRTPVAPAVPLPDEDAALAELSRERILALSLAEMRAIRSRHSDPELRRRRATLGLPDEPTDVELECLAQTWSEHCKHKIFNAQISYADGTGPQRQVQSLFKTCIVGATRAVSERVDWLVSVFHDNAGVVRAGPDVNLVFKVETHNSPSALDPYGGAITGIVGVNRDPFGTGIGAALLTNTWGYCFGPPNHGEELPAGLLHPRRIRDGVHQGVIDGGNQSGIPYSRGFEVFDERFIGKPLVFCGTVGVMPHEIGGVPTEHKEARPGDLVVMVGGRIGKDGIHGATFSSEALHQESPAQAVQIGDPITQKMMLDMLIEARDQGLYRTLTDNGAGGLSSSVGEMARLSGGAELDLDHAPLKYPGLMPWEILVSEAQERMTLAVPPEQLDALLELARRREVEATPIGRFTDDGQFRLRYAGKVVGEISLEFLHDGCPVMELEALWAPPRHPEPADVGIALTDLDAGELLLDVVGGLNFGAGADKCRQYDHEVKGLSVVKPLVGVHGDVPADASVMRIRHGDERGVLLSDAIAPRLSDIDPGIMAGHVVDLAVRRLVAAGAKLGYIAALDNFCWPDPVQSEGTPDGRHKLAGLVRCCETLHDFTCALSVPLISGKDSMKNDSVRGGVKISIPPTLLLSAMAWVDDARQAVDLVPDGPGLEVFVLGQTQDALGASELYVQLSRRSGRVVGNRLTAASPQDCQLACSTLQQAIEAGYVQAAHAPHLGGLGAAFATLCLAGDVGIEVDLQAIPSAKPLSAIERFFAETPSRFVVVTQSQHGDGLLKLCAERGLPAARVGRTTSNPQLVLTGHTDSSPTAPLAIPLATLRQRYTQVLSDGGSQ